MEVTQGRGRCPAPRLENHHSQHQGSRSHPYSPAPMGGPQRPRQRWGLREDSGGRHLLTLDPGPAQDAPALGVPKGEPLATHGRWKYGQGDRDGILNFICF